MATQYHKTIYTTKLDFDLCLKLERQLYTVLLEYSQFEGLSKDNFDWYFKYQLRTYSRNFFNQHLQNLHT